MSRICARRLISVSLCACLLWSAAAAAGEVRAAGKVTGAVWNADNTPVAGAKVRLRNIATGAIDATAVASEAGEFTIENVAPASYAVELVDDAGRIRAIGQRFEVQSGETIATFLRLPAQKPWFAGFFSNAALAVIAAASTAGVTALGSNAPPASPQ